jgi:Domain of unknown function (DUF6458)
MSIAAGIVFIVVGAILTFAVKGGHIGDLDLHAVGVILMLAGVVGMLLPALIRNRSRFSRPTARRRQDASVRRRHDVVGEETRTVSNHANGSLALVEEADGPQTVAEHIEAVPPFNDGRKSHDSGRPRAGSA